MQLQRLPFLSGRPTAQSRHHAANKDALQDWNAQVEDAKLTYVCDLPFPNQGKENVHAVRHSIASCLYYLELIRLKNIARDTRKRKQEEDLKGAPLKRDRK